MPTKKPLPKKNGRPSKRTPDTVATICLNIEMGLPLKLAAEAEGVSETTIHDWIKNDPEVSGAVTRARARAAMRLTQQAKEGGKGSQVCTWFLERLFRKEYGPVQKIELGGDPDGVPIETSSTLDKLSLEEIRALARGSAAR